MGAFQEVVGWSETYKESTGNEDNDTALVIGGLGIEGRDLVLDLLKGEALLERLLTTPTRSRW